MSFMFTYSLQNIILILLLFIIYYITMKKLSLNQWVGVVLAIVIVSWFFASNNMSMFSFNKNPNDTINNNKNMMTEENTNGAGVNMGADNSLVMQDTLVGGGEMAVNGKSITANYTGMLQDGTVFDSSVGRAPFTFTLGAGMVIRGWDKGIEGMKVGGKRRLIIAPDMAYGSAGITAPDGKVIIPENATLVFDVELLGVK